jgi:hypothetical protein
VVDVEENALLKILHKQKHRAWAFYGFLPNFFHLNFWTFTTCVLVIYLFATMRRSQCRCQDQYNYENGYETEFRKHLFSFIMYK